MQYNRILDGTMEVANHLKNSTMEAENQVKHGASSKSLTSRVNFFRKACFAFLLAGFLFSGCELDSFVGAGSNDGMKTLSVEITGNQYNDLIDEMRLMINDEVLATAPYADGKFTLTLPDNVATGHLYGILEWVYASEGVEITNPNALMAWPEIIAYKDGSPVGEIYTIGDTQGHLVYFSSELKITGKYTETSDRNITSIEEDIYDYSINVKRGWSMIYGTSSYETESTETGIKEVSTIKRTSTGTIGNLEWRAYFSGYNAVTAGEDLEITAQVETPPGNVNRVLVRSDDYRGVAAGVFESGGFTLTLPNKAYPGASIGDGYQLSSLFGGGTSNLTISNEGARLEIIEYFEGYTSASGAWTSNHNSVDFIHGKFDENSVTRVWYIFSSADVEITRATGSVIYNMDLKAGWNIVYEIYTKDDDDEIITTVTTTEEVSDLKWYTDAAFDAGTDEFYTGAGPFSVKRATKSLNSRRNSRMFVR